MWVVLKSLGALVLVCAALLIVVINFSAVEARYECRGRLGNDSGGEPATVYFVLERYRWWVGLWSDSDGNLRLEVPNRWLSYYAHVTEVGDQLQIRNGQDDDIAGHFSTLSKTLALRTGYGVFDGACTQIES
jgi:hypothetical protein